MDTRRNAGRVMAQDVPTVDWILERLRANWPGFGVEDDVARQATEVLWSNLRRASDVTSIVQHLPVTRRTIERHFRRQYGCTISEVSAFTRLELAKWLLAETSLPIHSVAMNAGYTSSDWLGKVVRRNTGMTPSEYRLQSRERGMTNS